MKIKKIFTSILIIILVFLCFSCSKVEANFFSDDDDESDIEKIIDEDEGGLFEKIIAKMIGGIAEGVFDLTTNETFGVGFKEYDELIFANTDNDLAPFTTEQWNKIMQWYKVMTYIASVPILIAVIVLAYKIIISGFNVEQRKEAKDNILRLFFGGAAIALAPLFVKFMLYLNNNLVRILVAKVNGGSLDGLIGNSILSNISTGNAILTSIVIAMFAYLFIKLNIKFIIRQFTLLVFTVFTPIVATLWIINKRAIGASIWFGQIMINAFMQFIYAFLFLIYLSFLPSNSGWAISLLWAMMILPLADVLQNTLQNLISRIAGIQNDEIANRGIGMAHEMGHTVKAFAYQFGDGKGSDILNKFMKRTTVNQENNQMTNPVETSPVNTNIIQTTPTKTRPIETKKSENNTETANNIGTSQDSLLNGKQIGKNNTIFQKKNLERVAKVGSTFMNTGMYMAEGNNFRSNRFNKNSQDDTKKRKVQELNNTAKMENDKDGT